jgi:NAD(P)-dependent dehydrogenase (short-subunit alcohol dehydrogenase family)
MPMQEKLESIFSLDGKVVVITGGAGLLGTKHAEVVAELGGTPWIIDIHEEKITKTIRHLEDSYGGKAYGRVVNITSKEEVEGLCQEILKQSGRIDVLINNAANNPKVEKKDGAKNWTRFENFPKDVWNDDLSVGLTGAFLCSQVLGYQMSKSHGGVILNIASDLGIIGPDQRIYRNEGESSEDQDVKPVTYSVVKAGLIGLTRYLATYWPKNNVRANALAPGGVYAGQDDAFVERLTNLIPLGRMAEQDEYKGVVAFMISDASTYLNGSIISVDGGRTVW